MEGWEHRVALGSVGFSRGVHYWEFTIDNYTADTDPAFGVARIDVARNKMLGKYRNGVRWPDELAVGYCGHLKFN